MENRHQLRLKIAGLATLATISVAGSAPGFSAKVRKAQAAPVVLTAGTVIPVKLNSELSSDQSRAGDTFTATVDDSKPAYRAIMRGGTVDGVVREATAKDGNNPGLLDLSFTRLRLPDGRSFALSGAPTSLDTKNLRTRSNGVLEAKNTSKNDRLKYAGIGAGAVALVKVLGGNKVKITDILIGGALGYGVGSILKSPKQVHDVTLKPGTQVGVLLGYSVRYTKVARKPVARKR
jgi:hypothetical protein